LARKFNRYKDIHDVLLFLANLAPGYQFPQFPLPKTPIC
jgi:hypothetical protein